MLHSRKLQYINEIARCGSIRKAAARLNVASSAINRQILALEAEIGVPIFERLPRGLRLTAAGELCIEHIRDVLKNYERLESRIRGLKMPQAGKVSIVTTVGLAAGPLPDIIARFIGQHPRVRVQLRNDGGSTTLNPVLTGEADIGLGFNIQATPGIRTLANFDVPIGVVLPPGHRLAGPGGPISLADVVQERLVLAQTGTSLRDVINLALAPLPVSVEPVVETNASEMLKQLVKAGTGLTLLNPLDVIVECRRGELVFRPIAETHSRQPMKLFARARAPLDAATSLFVEYLMTELMALMQELQANGSILAADK
ncbi:transcriptional regulator, LysR family [Rhizobium sp. PDO1-076]|uniref:LysR family transcriptional regulator n=1 Tax=Rhizobium sp. PDO1-076 TaxID=1125979 RepID=UPI00024E39C2|nr:LysR family transcriptional regulator [Rhizobium sp. PDO1-076]EHS49519.1 transcriptional regulator, LysR family [Rhizobium sp. PDO1-076]